MWRLADKLQEKMLEGVCYQMENESGICEVGFVSVLCIGQPNPSRTSPLLRSGTNKMLIWLFIYMHSSPTALPYKMHLYLNPKPSDSSAQPHHISSRS